jgi:hypothetical protein
MICMQMYIFTIPVNKIYACNDYHSSESSSLMLLSISLRRFMRMFVIATFYLSSELRSALRPESVKRIAEVMGDKFSSLNETRVRVR